MMNLATYTKRYPLLIYSKYETNTTIKTINKNSVITIFIILTQVMYYLEYFRSKVVLIHSKSQESQSKYFINKITKAVLITIYALFYMTDLCPRAARLLKSV